MNVKGKEFELLMNIYEKGLEQVLNKLSILKCEYRDKYGYDIISDINKRIKTPKSIINKMQKKGYRLNYYELIEYINDIAGIRLICPAKSDIYELVKIIKAMQGIRVIKTKDYIRKPKRSGYSGYHLIVETEINMNEKIIPIKVEIQIRTIAMDFWAENEHNLKYKTNKKVSKKVSRKLMIYAKMIEIIDEKIMKLYKNNFSKKVHN